MTTHALAPGVTAPRTLPLEWLIIGTPVLNALADVTTNFFDRGVTTGAMRAAILVFLLAVGATRTHISFALISLYAFLGYLFFRSLAASNLEMSLADNYAKVFISMMMFPLGYFYIKDWHLVKRLHVAVLVGGMIIVGQFVLAQVLGLGISVYVDDSFYIGGAKVQTTYSLALAVAVAPVMFMQFPDRFHRFCLGVAMILFVTVTILVVRRGAILGMVVAVAVYSVLTPHKARAFRQVGIALLLLAAMSPIFLSNLLPRVQARSFENRPLETEGRYLETFAVANEFVTQPVRHALFGSEMFNSQEYFGVVRALHVDYNVLLHGGGLTAIGLAALIYLAVIVQHRRLNRVLKRVHAWFAEMNAVFYGILAMSLVISLSGSMSVIGYRSTLFLYLGAFLGIQEASWKGLRRLGEALRHRAEDVTA